MGLLTSAMAVAGPRPGEKREKIRMRVSSEMTLSTPKTSEPTVAVIAIVSLPYYVRLVRGQVQGLRASPLAEAARATGASRSRIILRHLLPNSLGPALAFASVNAGWAILIDYVIVIALAAVTVPHYLEPISGGLATGTGERRSRSASSSPSPRST